VFVCSQRGKTTAAATPHSPAITRLNLECIDATLNLEEVKLTLVGTPTVPHLQQDIDIARHTWAAGW